RCDTCGHPLEDVVPDTGAVETARGRLSVPGVELPVRRQWPSGMATLGVELSGKVPEAARPETGRAVARMDGIGWGSVLRDLFAPGPDGEPVDGEVPVALRRAITEVLDAWAPAVDGVVVVASASRPTLVEHLAVGVARHLGVPVVGAVAPRPGVPAGRHDVNSAQRLASVVHRLELDLSPAAAAGLPGRAVLLVDDRYDSGWTVTVAARLLRDAGAAHVLPFTLAVG